MAGADDVAPGNGLGTGVPAFWALAAPVTTSTAPTVTANLVARFITSTLVGAAVRRNGRLAAVR